MTLSRVLLHRVAASAVVMWLVLAGAPSARANQIYTYTGKTFTSASAPFTTANRVTVTFTLTSALAANATTDVLASPNLVAGSFQMSAGPLSLSLSDLTPTGAAALDVDTGPTGLITSWTIIIGTTDQANTANFLSTHRDASIAQDIADAAPLVSFPQFGDAVVDNDPGTWSVVPEPSSALLLAAGFGGIAYARKRRLR